MKYSYFSLLISLFISASPMTAAAQSLKPEEIVSKHLDSIGASGKRAEMKTIMAIGASEFEMVSPAVKGAGRAVMVSNPGNLMFIISLNSKEYQFEKIGYFDGKVHLPFINAGNRSLLGTFLNEHDRVVSKGLFGGTMSMRWPLLLGDKKAVMKSSGTKKVGERKAYVIDYLPVGVGSSDFTIRLFFDAENFNHLRTEYRREVVRGQGTFGQQNQQANAVINLTEDFSDHKAVDGLTMPYTYRIKFSSNSNTTSNENRWGVKIAEYRLNQALQDGFFTFDPK